MLRFSRCKFTDDASDYENCDCTGAVRVILRDYGGGIELPADVQDWKRVFEMLPWPVELKDLDVVLMAYDNKLGLVDHMAVHVGNNYIVHLGKHTGGLRCERVNRYQTRILHVARLR